MTFKVLHIITGLGQGGAEEDLYKIITAFKNSGFLMEDIVVVSLTIKSFYGPKLSSLGVRVVALNLNKTLTAPWSIINCCKLINKFEPDIIHAWMYHANIFASIMNLFCTKATVIWSVLASLYNIKNEKLSTRWVIRLSKLLSIFSSKITYNSYASQKQHIEIGYYERKSLVIHNGFCCKTFIKDNNIYKKIRTQFGLEPNIKLDGIFARFHPVKNHEGFLKVASIIKDKYRNSVKFIMAGSNINGKNNILGNLIKQYGLIDDVMLLDCVNSVDYMPALDLLLSLSWGESFSNSIGEALLCGVPCVATDVGDAKFLIKNYGAVVKVGDDKAIAKEALRILNISSESYQELSHSARQYIINQFSMDKNFDSYKKLYKQVLGCT